MSSRTVTKNSAVVLPLCVLSIQGQMNVTLLILLPTMEQKIRLILTAKINNLFFLGGLQKHCTKRIVLGLSCPHLKSQEMAKTAGAHMCIFSQRCSLTMHNHIEHKHEGLNPALLNCQYMLTRFRHLNTARSYRAIKLHSFQHYSIQSVSGLAWKLSSAQATKMLRNTVLGGNAPIPY